MLFKLAALSMIAATTHIQQTAPDRAQWVYDSGENKGYVCGVVQQNGPKFDVYLPVLWPAPVQKAGAPAAMTAVPWLHFATSKEAMEAITTYCPVGKAS